MIEKKRKGEKEKSIVGRARVHVPEGDPGEKVSRGIHAKNVAEESGHKSAGAEEAIYLDENAERGYEITLTHGQSSVVVVPPLVNRYPCA